MIIRCRVLGTVNTLIMINIITIKTIVFIMFTVIMMCQSVCNCQNNKLSEKEKKTIIKTCVSAFNTYYVYPDIALEMEEKVMAYNKAISLALEKN